MMTNFRYVAVAVSSALLHNAVMIAYDAIGIITAGHHRVLRRGPVGYGLHSWFTFRQAPSVRSLLTYAAGMAMNVPGSIALMFVFCDLAGLSVPVAAPATTLVLFVWNFAVSRWAILGRLSLQKAA